jgi:hypothetical protein
MSISRYDEDGAYNVWSRICHRPSCQAIQNANRRNLKAIRSWKVAVELGLKPCGICTPFFTTESLAALKTTLSSESSMDEEIAAKECREQQLDEVETPEIEAAKSTQIQLPTAEVTEWRRRIAQAISRLDQNMERPPKEGLAARISRLSRAGVIPRHIANMMLTITELRNAVEHESKALSVNENLAAWANWNVVQEWAVQDGLQI